MKSSSRVSDTIIVSWAQFLLAVPDSVTINYRLPPFSRISRLSWRTVNQREPVGIDHCHSVRETSWRFFLDSLAFCHFLIFFSNKYYNMRQSLQYIRRDSAWLNDISNAELLKCFYIFQIINKYKLNRPPSSLLWPRLATLHNERIETTKFVIWFSVEKFKKTKQRRKGGRNPRNTTVLFVSCFAVFW